MMLHPGPTTDRPATDSDPLAEIRRLQRDLERMRVYAQTLEERCNHLWTYVPDTHGARDPALPFVALHSHIMTLEDDGPSEATA